MKVKNPGSQNIRIFPRSIKKRICTTEKFTFFNFFSFMHSILDLCTLVGTPLAQMTASVRCGMEAISLWHFRSSVLLDRLFLILLKISHRFHMRFSSGMLAGQSSSVMSWSANHLEVALVLWTGAKVLLEKEISISIKLVSRWKH